MKSELQKYCELFIANKEKMKESSWEYVSIYTVVANMFTAKNLEADVEKMKECKKLLKEKTGALSNFRGNVMLPAMSMLALDEDPEARMERANVIYKKLKEEFKPSEFMTLAAMILAGMVSEDEADEYVKRGKTLYKMMKKEHPFITGSEDAIFAILLAFSDKSDEEIISNVEKTFSELKNYEFSSDGIQTVSLLFALTEGDNKERCDRLVKVREMLKEEGRKYGKDFEICVLAALVMLPVELETIVEEMLEIDEFLSNQKDYGFLGYDKRERLMHSAMLLGGFYSTEDSNNDLGAIASTMAMLVVQQAILFAVIGATVVASSGGGN